jgi:hypothetical protein
VLVELERELQRWSAGTRETGELTQAVRCDKACVILRDTAGVRQRNLRQRACRGRLKHEN